MYLGVAFSVEVEHRMAKYEPQDERLQEVLLEELVELPRWTVNEYAVCAVHVCVFVIVFQELLMLKLRPQTIYVTMTKPFIIDFSEPLNVSGVVCDSPSE